jgi:subtilisin family serine protease
VAPVDLVQLPELMRLTFGSTGISVGLIDGPVAINHSDLTGDNIREVPGAAAGGCARAGSTACLHGTFVAGILCARRSSAAPAICPGCTLLVRPVFAESFSADAELPSAGPGELAAAIVECVNAGARIINLSLALMQSSARDRFALAEALDHAARHGVILVAAAGNQGAVASTIITAHPW